MPAKANIMIVSIIIITEMTEKLCRSTRYKPAQTVCTDFKRSKKCAAEFVLCCSTSAICASEDSSQLLVAFAIRYLEDV